MRKWLMLVVVGMGIGMSVSVLAGTDDAEIKTFGQKFTSALGYQLGSDLAAQI